MDVEEVVGGGEEGVRGGRVVVVEVEGLEGGGVGGVGDGECGGVEGWGGGGHFSGWGEGLVRVREMVRRLGNLFYFLILWLIPMCWCVFEVYICSLCMLCTDVCIALSPLLCDKPATYQIPLAREYHRTETISHSIEQNLLRLRSSNAN